MLISPTELADTADAATGARQEAVAMHTPGRDPNHPSTTPVTRGTRLTREQILDRILDINPGATSAFLHDFDHVALADYLDRLIRLRDHRGSSTRWIRRSGPPATVSRAWRHARGH